MQSLASPTQHLPKLAHPAGSLVSCIHCFRILGRDTAATPRKLLIATHKCRESLLAKLPAAPPPYN